jgi:glycosyltransferase involved in cell wall biosynthesis
MHVAHVSPRYLPAQLRGGEQYVRMLCEQQAKFEKTTVLTSNAINIRGNEGRAGDYYTKEKRAAINGVDIIRFPVAPRISQGLNTIVKGFKRLSPDWLRYEPLDYIRVLGWGPLTPSMYSYILTANFDFVHAAIWPTTTLFTSFLACKKTKIPFAITPFYHYRLREFTQSSLLRKILPSCTAIIAVTEGERKELLKIGGRPERTFVVPLSIDAPGSQSNPETFRKKYRLEGKFVILTHPWIGKGAGDVVLAVKQLSKKFPNLAIVTFGEPDKEYLRILSSLSPLGFTALNLGWIYGK